MICILAQRGRFLETILQDGARSGVPRLRREPYRGRFGPRPPGVDGLARAVAARPVFHCRGGQRGSAAGKRHGGAPKGVPVAPGRSAPYERGRRASHARQKSKSAPVGAPSTPRSGGRIAAVATAAGAKALVGSPADGKAKVHAKRRINPDAATRRGNEEHCVRLSEGAQHENRLI